jgi:hypothetical protein
LNDDAPLTTNERALAISVLVVGGLIVLFTLMTIAQAGYVLATGQAFGSRISKAFTQLSSKKGERAMKDLMERQLEVQSEVQKRWAPKQLVSETVYLFAVGGAILCAILALGNGRYRARIGQLALAASAVRIGVGVVTYLMTSELMKATTGAMMETMARGPSGSSEKTADIARATQGAMAGLSALSAGCWTLVVCIYFAVVAYVFLVRKPASPTAQLRQV